MLCVSWSFLGARGTNDVAIWLHMVFVASVHGVVEGYARYGTDYPPLGWVLLALVDRLGAVLSLDPHVALKLSLFGFLGLTGLAIRRVTGDLRVASAVVLGSAVGTAALGYLDAYYFVPLVVALTALRRGALATFSATYTVACLCKWQPLLIGPFLLVHALRAHGLRWRTLWRLAWPAMSILALVTLFFGVEPARALRRAMSHDALSLQGLNVGWILQHALHVFAPERYGHPTGGPSDLVHVRDQLTAGLAMVLRMAFLALYAWALYCSSKRRCSIENVLTFSLVGYLCYFVLNPGVHENHLMLPVLLAGMLAGLDRAHFGTFVALAVASNANLVLFYGLSGEASFDRVLVVDGALLVAFVFVGMFLRFFVAHARPREPVA